MFINLKVTRFIWEVDFFLKTVFVNPERCVGCMQCQVACAVEHSQSKNLYQALYESPRPQARIYASPGKHLNTSFPNKCRHCDPAPCLEACPTEAITRDQDTNIVVIDGDKCISCAMCAMVCPYDVIRYHESPWVKLDNEVATKCDNCIERQREGREPACVEVCKVDALKFGDINQIEKEATSKLAKSVSIAEGMIEPDMPELPENYESWQEWGEEVGEINKNTQRREQNV